MTQNLTASIMQNEISNPLILATNDISVSKKKIIIISSGSRGDVQPYIALGLALQERGHDVTIVTEKRIESLVLEFKLKYSPIAGDPVGVIFEKDSQKILKDGSLFQIGSLVQKWEKKFNKMEILNSYITACGTADLIISGALTLTQSYCISEKIHAKWIPVILGPTLKTSEFPIWPLKSIIPFSCLNKWSYNVCFKALWDQEKKDINEWRKTSLDLPPINNERGLSEILENKPSIPIIVACSTLFTPVGRKPFDYPNNSHMNGFLFVPPAPDSEISNELKLFFGYSSESSEETKESKHEKFEK